MKPTQDRPARPVCICASLCICGACPQKACKLQSQLELTAGRGAIDTGSPRSPSLHTCFIMHLWGLPRLQCARGNLYFCSSEPEPTESKGRLVIGTRLKASRGQGGSLNYLTVAPREEITLLTHPPCQEPTGNLWSLTAVRDLMGTSKVRRLCLGFGCWYPYYVPFVIRLWRR